MCNDCLINYNDSQRGTVIHQQQTPVSGDAKHLDDGKIGLQYVLSMPGLAEVAKVGDFGSKKYGQWNYKSGMPWMKLFGSCSRHLVSAIQGEDIDKESGCYHLAHLCYDALMLLGYMLEKKGTDDRYGNS